MFLNPKDIQFIVLHCSESPDGRNDTAADIHRWHTEKGWSGIGYHYVIRRDGGIERGRPEYWQGAHVKGFNDKSLGICLIGTKSFEGRQLNTVWSFLRKLSEKYPKAAVVGHYELDNKKTCPNIDMDLFWRHR